METYREKIKKEYGCKFFELDAYGGDRGLAAVRKQLDGIGSRFNVIMSSLGPKLTAVALYKLQRVRPEAGLVYAPATEFSATYSFGIGHAFWGEMRLGERRKTEDSK